MSFNRRLIVGIDEAGRGPLAGPVYAAAVSLPDNYQNAEITDSKKVNSKKREELFDEIINVSLAYAIAFCGPREIERLNILQATKLAMSQAANKVLEIFANDNQPREVHFLVDGNQPLPAEFSSEAIVKGDQKEQSIAAASILAKVARDREMQLLDDKYPGYGLAKHKGYPTKAHLERIRALGPCEIHRRTFAGVREYL